MAEQAGPTDRDLADAVRQYCPETLAALKPHVGNGKYKARYSSSD